MSSIQELKSLDEFRELINSDTLVVVYFYADFGSQCKTTDEILPQIMEEYPNVIFAKVDINESPEIAEEWGFYPPPYFMYFKNGEKLDHVVGSGTGPIIEKISSLL